MNLKKHLDVEGRHAIMSPSKYHWIFDGPEDFERRVATTYYAELGTLLHNEARKRIQYKYKLSKSDKRSVLVNLLDGGIPERIFDNVDFNAIYDNLSSYVNDAINYRMEPEVVLYFSENCFGTADAIYYDEQNRFLRIHDLKTGTSAVAKMEQLYVYAALFFLEYSYVKLGETQIELRIYQNNEIKVDTPNSEVIVPIMEKIRAFNKIVNIMKGMDIRGL